MFILAFWRRKTPHFDINFPLYGFCFYFVSFDFPLSSHNEKSYIFYRLYLKLNCLIHSTEARNLPWERAQPGLLLHFPYRLKRCPYKISRQGEKDIAPIALLLIHTHNMLFDNTRFNRSVLVSRAQFLSMFQYWLIAFYLYCIASIRFFPYLKNQNIWIILCLRRGFFVHVTRTRKDAHAHKYVWNKVSIEKQQKSCWNKRRKRVVLVVMNHLVGNFVCAFFPCPIMSSYFCLLFNVICCLEQNSMKILVCERKKKFQPKSSIR